MTDIDVSLGVLPIDIAKVKENDSLEGFWWYYIRNDFAFQKSIGKTHYNAFDVTDMSILVHKQVVGEDKFPTTRYHIIIHENKEPKSYVLDGKDIRKYLAQNFTKYVQTYHKLPFGCKIHKESANSDILTISYEPLPKYFELKFQINIEKAEFDINEVRNYAVNDNNPLGYDLIETFAISPIPYYNNLMDFAIQHENKIEIEDATITAIDMRISRFKEHETPYYLIHIENGVYTSQGCEKFPLHELNFKLSKDSMDKSGLQVGNKVNLHGKMKSDNKLGILVQNVKIK